MAMKPEWRPINLTSPMPCLALLASTLAASRALWAASTAVSKPKHLSMTCNRGPNVLGWGWDKADAYDIRQAAE